jgi:hypothetical protein
MALKLGSFTTAARASLPAQAGMMIYNTDYDKFQVYTTQWSNITVA